MKNPVGRPRKDGRPAGYYKNSGIAGSGPALRIDKRSRSHPRKDDTIPGSKRVRKASAPAPVSQLAPGPSVFSLPLQLPSRHAPSQAHVGAHQKPEAGAFTQPEADHLYNNTLVSTPSDMVNEFDDDIDGKAGDTDYMDVNAVKLEGTERVLSRFRLNEEKKMFQRMEDEDDPPAEEQQKAQTEGEIQEASGQHQKKMCEVHNCYNQDCRINHARRANVEFYVEGLPQRISRLYEHLDLEVETAAPMEDTAATEGGEKPAYSMETESDCNSQFETLFFDIIEGRARSQKFQSNGETFPQNFYRLGPLEALV
ncbi:hypothetical protein G6011_00277 [Alternaria panax]|uniref:Uncharacterized protein n=1 Tax=Alternaria panax TaxID=48097 RepID=A0AAD4NUK4_9PLEO|nr:hypothetical protein G6011_00277 [Alternaria panax]